MAEHKRRFSLLHSFSCSLCCLAAVVGLASVAIASETTDTTSLATSHSTSDYELRSEELMIPMSDGVRLHACLTMPVAAVQGEKFPALLSMDPYSGSCAAGRSWYSDYARAGYGLLYVHVRGTGLSEGNFPSREYSIQELDDAEYLIDWLSRQTWSTGNVGMFGASWSGFNSLQVAMRKPPALKAIVPYVATEDIYHEDVHFADGIFRFDEYNTMADLRLVHTPEPADPLDEQTLRNRFDRKPWSLVYLRQQRDGDFWRRNIRVDHNPGSLQVPTMMIGGWYDGYRNAILRALSNVRAPIKAIIGPWDHGSKYPKPAAALARETIRWWDYWLKGRDNGIIEEPQVHVYMRRPYLPNARTGAIPGEWRAVSTWPPADAEEQQLYLTRDHELRSDPGSRSMHRLRYVPSGGIQAGIWWGDSMPDQRPADAYSLVYESEPLERELQVLGGPHALLRASASAPHANWMVRLEDRAPDGTVTLITGAARNGAHRNSAVDPEPLVPGETYTIEIPLHFTSWIFEAGHRIRLAVSNSLWPMFWPTPYAMTTKLELGNATHGSMLTLPVVPAASDRDIAAAAAAVGSRNLSAEEADTLTPPGEMSWIGPSHVEHDVLNGTTRVWYSRGSQGNRLSVEYEVSDENPARARVTGRSTTTRKWHGDDIEWIGETEIVSDATTFHYRHHRKLLQNDKIIREKIWTEAVPRDFQ